MARAVPSTLLALVAIASASRAVEAGAPPFAADEVPRSELVVSDPPARPAARAMRSGAPVLLYLNRAGGVYTPGQPNDARRNVSSVPGATAAIEGWDVDAAIWLETRACVEEILAPFNFAITEVDPGDQPHVEVSIGGDPSAIGAGPSVAGMSPFYSDCSVVDDSIVYVFPSVLGHAPARVCETIAQEVAHSFGLDHVLQCDDPMSYLTGCGEKAFRYAEAPCGELTARECRCGETQNSARMLLERVGPGRAPAFWLAAPADGAVLGQGFRVTAAANLPPASVALYIDGALVERRAPEAGGELIIPTPRDLEPGEHTIELVATYADGERRATALVTVEPYLDASLEGGCAAGGARSTGLGLALVGLALAARRRRRA